MNTKQIVFTAQAQEIFTRLANEKNFPIGVLFDWSKI